MYQYYNTMEYTIDGNILTMIMPFTEHNLKTYSEENLKRMGIPATVSIIITNESITKMVGGFAPQAEFATVNTPDIYDELRNDSNVNTMTIPYQSFYLRMKYLTNMFGNKINDGEREGLFLRTFKEIPVIVNKGFQKIKHILDDINAPKIQRDEIEFHSVVVNDVYDVTVKDDNDKKLFENKPTQIIETPVDSTFVPSSDSLSSQEKNPIEALQKKDEIQNIDSLSRITEGNPRKNEPTSEKKIKCVCIGEEVWNVCGGVGSMYECEKYVLALCSFGVMCSTGVCDVGVMLCSNEVCVYYGVLMLWLRKMEGSGMVSGVNVLSEMSKEVLRIRKIK